MWPLLVLIVGRRWLVPTLGVIAVASLAYAVRRVAQAPEPAYFSTGTRAWELALGGLLALGLTGRQLGPRTGAALAWCGLAAIAVATLTFDAGTAVPALPTLLPTLGAAALVAAGSSATPALPTRVLSVRPVRFVGRISYAWYIWHWPALVFAAAAWGPLSTPAALAVTAASLAPTLVTHRWIEEPIRRSRLAVPRITLATAPVAAALVLAAATAVSWSVPAQTTLAADEAEGAAQLGRTAAIQRSATALRPSPRDADDDRGRSFRDGCLVDADAPARRPASMAPARRATTVVLFGDSHAMQWFPALERIARSRRWRLVELTKAGCPPAAVSVVYAPLGRAYPECDVWRSAALARIARERPALVDRRRLRPVPRDRAAAADWTPSPACVRWRPATGRSCPGCGAAPHIAVITESRSRPGTSPTAWRARCSDSRTAPSRATRPWRALAGSSRGCVVSR